MFFGCCCCQKNLEPEAPLAGDSFNLTNNLSRPEFSLNYIIFPIN